MGREMKEFALTLFKNNDKKTKKLSNNEKKKKDYHLKNLKEQISYFLKNIISYTESIIIRI